MSRFWVSWYQPTEDYRPLADPPNAAILGWWCSGERCSDGAATLCALVSATTTAEVKSAIRIDWPEAREWRFVDEVADGWSPNNRFPVTAKWMRERLESRP